MAIKKLVRVEGAQFSENRRHYQTLAVVLEGSGPDAKPMEATFDSEYILGKNGEQGHYEPRCLLDDMVVETLKTLGFEVDYSGVISEYVAWKEMKQAAEKAAADKAATEAYNKSPIHALEALAQKAGLATSITKLEFYLEHPGWGMTAKFSRDVDSDDEVTVERRDGKFKAFFNGTHRQWSKPESVLKAVIEELSSRQTQRLDELKRAAEQRDAKTAFIDAIVGQKLPVAEDDLDYLRRMEGQDHIYVRRARDGSKAVMQVRALRSTADCKVEFVIELSKLGALLALLDRAE